ncbi:MAG: Mur ligase domain-containing protein, partial [Flavobacteriaceae bacterium]
MKKLKEILYKVAIEGISGSTDVDVNRISVDSRTVKPGNMYVAIKGVQVDGHRFIDQAIDSGAQSIICEILPKTLAEGVVFIKVGDAREALAWAAVNFYDNPSYQLQLIG